MRPVAIAVLLLLLALVAYGAYSCATALSKGSTFSAPSGHFPINSVTYLASDHTYLVHLPNGSFLALSEQEASAADRISGCLIRYRPDLTVAGVRGIFLDDCHNVAFNLMGQAIQGSSPPMQRHPVTVHGGAVTVQTNSCLSGSTGQAEPCRM